MQGKTRAPFLIGNGLLGSQIPKILPAPRTHKTRIRLARNRPHPAGCRSQGERIPHQNNNPPKPQPFKTLGSHEVLPAIRFRPKTSRSCSKKAITRPSSINNSGKQRPQNTRRSTHTAKPLFRDNRRTLLHPHPRTRIKIHIHPHLPRQRPHKTIRIRLGITATWNRHRSPGI